jgi:hypothetical protein
MPLRFRGRISIMPRTRRNQTPEWRWLLGQVSQGAALWDWRCRRSPAYTAREIAGAAHIEGQNLAKTVIVKLDGKLSMTAQARRQPRRVTPAAHIAVKFRPQP